MDSLDRKATLLIGAMVIALLVVFIAIDPSGRPLKIPIGHGEVERFEVTTVRNFFGDFHEYITTVKMDDGSRLVVVNRDPFAPGARVIVEEWTNGLGSNLKKEEK